MRALLTALAAASFCLISGFATAHEVKLGSLSLEHPWSRATPNGAQVAAGYIEIINNGDTADRLISANDDFAGMTGLHQMSMDSNGVMKMEEVKGGIAIPAHQTVKLEPHAFHIMFMDLKHPLKQGEKVPVELVFEKAGKVTVDFVVGAIDANSAPAGE
jgi:hypothetical protein